MALFGEKYGDVVRVVDVPGVSLELCGGTHVGSTGQIALFRFTHETGAAAGVRRIEALTGPAAYRYALELQHRLTEAAALLKTQPEHLAKRIEAMLDEQKKLEKRLEELLRKGGGGVAGQELAVRNGPPLWYVTTDIEDRNQVALMVDGLRAQHPGSATVVIAPSTAYVGVGDALIPKLKAPEVINVISKYTGGRGGGRPHFASGSIPDPSKIPSSTTLVDLFSDFW
jgi:alanyl-tRNA synthetase